jgi:hypothetical protein
MNAHLAEIIATERIAELRREAAAMRLAADAPRGGGVAEALRQIRSRWSLRQATSIHWRRTA